jgi:hypothetical protein
MRYNALFAEIADEKLLGGVSQADLTGLFRQAVGEGWVRSECGAWLLKQFLATYSGLRISFADITGYEAAVNGRGVPDLDLRSDGIERARDLVKRGYAFARMALFRLGEMPDHPPVTAYISISPAEVDDGVVYTASVTFVAHHDGEPPYICSVEDVTSNAVLAVESADCTEPLPFVADQPQGRSGN